eukprot:scaffold18052_cov175-Amphora_coffeaeformis.AAC.14
MLAAHEQIPDGVNQTMLPLYSESFTLGEASFGESYFAAEDETELAPAKTLGSDGSAASGNLLTWRGDPSETHSDWTIVVVTDELQTVLYNVHKSVLCFGSRNSRYFARLLMSQESKKMTKVELDARDAANFPILLDYAYAPCSYNSLGTIPTAMSTLTSPSVLQCHSRSSEDEPSYMALGEEVNSSNAVSLRYLARKFEIDALMLAVNRFIQRDLNFETGPHYLSEAHRYNDQRLLESATRLCVENFESLDKKNLTVLPVEIFRNLIFSLQGHDEKDREIERSHLLSEIVCRYLEKHPHYITVDLMLELTDASIVPHIAADAAMGFTSLIKQLSVEDATTYWHDLVRLSRRCARSVVREYGWSDFSIDGAVDEYLQHCVSNQHMSSRVDSLLFATSFAAALDQAQEDYELMVHEQGNMQQMMRNLDSTLNIMEKMTERKDRYLSHQLKALDEAQKKIVLLEKELADTKRQRYHTPPPPPQNQNHFTSPSKRPSSHRNESSYKHESPLQVQHSTPNRSTPIRSPQPIFHSTPDSTPNRHTKSLLDDEMSRSQSTSDSFDSILRGDPAIRDLVSPQSIGTEIHRNKILKMRELRGKTARSYCGN